MLRTPAERATFDRSTANLAHAALCDEAARVMVRAEILASYKDRVSGEHAVPLARVRLVKREVRSA